jgi:hypothetical protein
MGEQLVTLVIEHLPSPHGTSSAATVPHRRQIVCKSPGRSFRLCGQVEIPDALDPGEIVRRSDPLRR